MRRFLGLLLTVLAAPVALAQSVFTTQVPALTGTDQPYELGMKFRSAVVGQLIKIRYYKPVGETGAHTGRIWSAAGTLLASAAFTNETASGWQEMDIAPLAIDPNTTYVVSVNSNTAYGLTINGLQTSVVNTPLSSVSDGSNGVYNTTPGQFPTNAFNNSNYFRDIVLSANVVNVTGVVVSPTSITLALTGSQQLTATVSPANATNANVRWQSSNPNVASVSSRGLVTATLLPGTATITAITQDGNKTATCGITVLPGSTLTAFVSQTNITCNGPASGAAQVMTSGGTAPYTYRWVGPTASGATTARISGLTTGTYAVTVSSGAQQLVRSVVIQSEATPTAAPPRLPAADEWRSTSVVATGEPYDVQAVTDPAYVPPTGSPALAGWPENVIFPGEGFALTGDAFTTRTGDSLGSDATVWVFAQTGRTGILTKAELLKISKTSLTASIPADLPMGLYTVWVENKLGRSQPIILNRPKTTFLGPRGNQGMPGDTMRVYGKNLSYQHDTLTSQVYLRNATSGVVVAAPVLKVDPYCVWFRVPANVPNGTHQVYVHTGQGGQYGFSDGLDLLVAPPWVRSDSTITIPLSGSATETDAIQLAIDQLSAMPSGGTVQLLPGTYTLLYALTLKPGVRLRGAGMNQTTVRLAFPTPQTAGILLYGNHSALEDFTLYLATNQTQYGPTKEAYNQVVYDINLRRVRFAGDNFDLPDTRAMLMQTTGGEITGCEFSFMLQLGGVGVWVHHNRFYGGPYYASEACINGGGYNLVLENNLFQTNWPTGPNGSRNYKDFLTLNQYERLVWAKRIIVGYNQNAYIAHNRANDVAVDDNRGEIFLYHGLPSGWYAAVSAASATTLAINTSGTIRGISTLVDGKPAATSVAAELSFQPVDELACVIIDGKGKGQYRKIRSHTGTSLTLETPWRVVPDTSSRITITQVYENVVIYKNELNAFPDNYTLAYSASTPIALDGNCMHFAAEGNVSRRTYSASGVKGNATSPSYWNDLRDERAFDVYVGGSGFTRWTWNGSDNHLVGAALLGNRILNTSHSLNTTLTVNSPFTPGPGLATDAPHQPAVSLTDESVSGLMQGVTTVGYPLGYSFMPTSSVVVRNSRFVLADVNGGGTEGNSLPASTQSLLLGNTYLNAITPYVASYTRLVPLRKTLHFTPAAMPDTLLLPIGNGGSVPVSVSLAASQPWVGISPVSMSSLAAESTTLVKVWINYAALNTAIPQEALLLLTGGGETKTVGILVAPGSSTLVPGTLPAAAGAIVGSTTLCQNQTGATYRVEPIARATTYLWTLPNGATGTSTSNTITIATATTALSGMLTVQGQNECGLGTPRSIALTFTNVPGPPDLISGPTDVFRLQTDITYTVPTIPGATSYVWTLPNGATGSSMSNTITVGYGANVQSGTLTVAGRNDCGMGAVRSLAIRVVGSITPTTLLTNQFPQAIGTEQPYELGMKFSSSVAGEITRIRYYKVGAESGSHTGRLWSATGTLLASAPFGAETASGWQEVTLPTPFTIVANTVYVVSVNSNTGYPSTPAGLQTAIVNPPLSSVADGNNGVFNTTPGVFPTTAFNNSNYFRDVVFVQRVFDLQPGPVYSLQNGAWNDPAVWSVGRVPLPSEEVEVRHLIDVPAAYQGTALRIQYVGAGQIRHGAASKLRLRLIMH